ncbi:hypothetical protein BX661DRAFT_198472 [Kickxella alabastrina]|uniref:uncharacterized protein n=1 Tax=Kickxella alabastrina TaxID=61397 RepID=UPI0022211578|nr:uncharacterized protein BX661DRAFT_198472 [Kickxella alabastrina]KAI7827911.1 hypothetical protein BX661DRAFT_198472 [Kickxella alabastrina]
MCKDLEIKIYQLSLLLQRHHQQLVDMDEKYKRMHQAEPEPLTKNSSLADWQEVINMAKLPIDPLFIYSQSNKTKSCEPVFKSIYHSPSSETTANSLSTEKLDEQNTSGIQVKRVSQATFPMQMTPPMEEIVQLREKVRALEKSPLFASMTTDNIKSKCSLAAMPVHRSPISQR